MTEAENTPPAPKPANGLKIPWYKKLYWQILIGMVIGAILGSVFNQCYPDGQDTLLFQLIGAVGDVFLKLLMMLVVPLIAASIITGIGSLKGHGVVRLTARTVVWYLLTTCLAVAAGLLVVNIIKPGVKADREALMAQAEKVPDTIMAQKDLGVGEAIFNVITDIVPSNIGKAIVDFKMLQIVFFSLFIGAMALAAGKRADPFFRFFDSLNAVMFKAVGVVILIAPLAVAALLTKELWRFGFDRLLPLGEYFIAVLLGLAIHAAITLPLLIRLIARRSPWQYFKQMREALVLAFSTASSGATLPVTIRCQVEKGHIKREVASFVTPLGATVNMDGTALYEAVAVFFLYTIHFQGVFPSFGEQVTIFLTAVLAAVGAAAIPHAGLVMMVIVLTAVGVPLEGIGLIIAVDRGLDMCRTMVNVWGDCACAAVINTGEERYEQRHPREG